MLWTTRTRTFMCIKSYSNEKRKNKTTHDWPISASKERQETNVSKGVLWWVFSYLAWPDYSSNHTSPTPFSFLPIKLHLSNAFHCDSRSSLVASMELHAHWVFSLFLCPLSLALIRMSCQCCVLRKRALSLRSIRSFRSIRTVQPIGPIRVIRH